MENLGDGGQGALLPFKLRDGVDQLLPVPVEMFDGDDRALNRRPSLPLASELCSGGTSQFGSTATQYRSFLSDQPCVYFVS
jgi:hypothetical protein